MYHKIVSRQKFGGWTSEAISNFTALILILILSGCTDRSNDITNPSRNGFTQLQGKLSGVLQLAQSPYQINDTIFVDPGQSLTIEKGVRLYFGDSTMFVIYGMVEAVGDSNYNILLTAFHNNWKGIRLIDSPQNSRFRYCVIEKVYTDWQDSSQFGALEINNSTATVQNCVFRLNYCYNGGGLSLSNDSSEIINNIFRENRTVVFGGGILAVESSAQIINNTFYGNSSENVGGGLVLWNPLAMDIQNNIFFENMGSDPWIHLAAGSSSGYSEQYNFLAMGSQDPRFVSDADLHLRVDSPCIDQGNPNPIFNDANGTRNDQGAYGGPLGR